MAIQSYLQPRSLRAFASLSFPVLLYRSLVAVQQLCPNVTPRDLIDDASFHWSGGRAGSASSGRGEDARELARAVRTFGEDVPPLGLIVQA
eukprot:230418-Pyramimonas_sp.AAC.1